MRNKHINNVRNGCIDIWNAFMVENAEFTLGSDMPINHYIYDHIPKSLVSYVEAKHIHKLTKDTNPNYFVDSFVHFYIDDHKFDGPKSSIWLYPEKSLDILKHFSGIITPDFSTYLDFPDPIKRYNTYRMRAYGYWISKNKIPVINNVRWNTEESWEYCFDGIPLFSIVSIGTVASGLNRLKNRNDFEKGLYKMVNVLHPHTILCYGSANYSCFDNLRAKGISVISYPSERSQAFIRKGMYEQM